MDRTLAPAFRQVENIELIKARKHTLPNGLEMFVIHSDQQDLVRLEFVFNNIDWDQAKPLQAYATNSMITDGTGKLNAAQIAEQIDYYGAFIQTDYNYDYSGIIVHTLNKHLPSILPVIRSILTNAVFPQEELDTFKRNQKQKLSVSLGKNDVVSRRTFNHVLFGESIYGYMAEAADYDRLTRDQLVEYFNKAYQPANCTLILSGRVTEDIIGLMTGYFGEQWQPATATRANRFDFMAGQGLEHYIERPDSLQSAIRIGKILINRRHEDFAGVQVVNTILGGYFGSRLMTNIREDKGYTYGIGSGIASLKNAGYFFISSEVGAGVCRLAINEIKKEVDLLRNKPVPEEELALVQNYMMGSLLGSLENVFSHADKFKSIHFSGLDYSYYERYIQTVKTITPARILDLAVKYLDFDGFEKVIVGKK